MVPQSDLHLRPWHRLTLGSGVSLVAKSCPTLAAPWTVACQAPRSVGFSRQEYWSGLPFPFPGNLPNPGVKPRSPALQADSLLTELRGKWKMNYIKGTNMLWSIAFLMGKCFYYFYNSFTNIMIWAVRSIPDFKSGFSKKVQDEPGVGSVKKDSKMMGNLP